MIDQFIVSGERKWHQRSGLTMLLPHGFDGNGPEHSSGRPERFLQMCDDDPFSFPPGDAGMPRQLQDCNIQVVAPSTPSNYFHALRRQLQREFRKPLIVFTSKALLRHPMARSDLKSMSDDTSFQTVLAEAFGESCLEDAEIKVILFCSGQIYYQLVKKREEGQFKDTVILRLEQISPFPFHSIQAHVNRYSKAKRIIWVQEEPVNMGAWTYVGPRFGTVLGHEGTRGRLSRKSIEVVARAPSASVATGKKKIHAREEEELLKRSFESSGANGQKA